jgi:hypothetical protein
VMVDLGNHLMEIAPRPALYEVSLEKKSLKGGGKLLVWFLPLSLIGKKDRDMQGRNRICIRKWMLLLVGGGRGYCISALVLLICEFTCSLSMMKD